MNTSIFLPVTSIQEKHPHRHSLYLFVYDQILSVWQHFATSFVPKTIEVFFLPFLLAIMLDDRPQIHNINFEYHPLYKAIHKLLYNSIHPTFRFGDIHLFEHRIRFVKHFFYALNPKYIPQQYRKQHSK